MIVSCWILYFNLMSLLPFNDYTMLTKMYIMNKDEKIIVTEILFLYQSNYVIESKDMFCY
ncbi:MAG TPA: hypothetical protein VI911_08620 [Patescibacteria group bacterium]|nr:MAG: hypothetical protein UR43_C0005G0109 [candidate division TM6 bacterium GW2011_GWF2_33_332]HLD91059.1 hypothetical protein [Patescibacteria group bacterium]